VQETDPHFEALLVHLKESRGFDFTGYKRSSLMRRVNRRMTQVGTACYPDYLDHLQVRPDEFTALFNTILINVTAFFRDAGAWEYLRAEVLEPMVAAKPAGSAIRIWSAGCASGEEAYTLAMVLAETLGADRFKDRVKIYATDVDEEGLTEARQASYGERDVQHLAPDLVERYFERAGGRFTFRRDLRRSVVFGRNDLVQDAPISRIDLLTCRNTLMYLNAETQSKILGRFHFALADTGVLFLGRAETLPGHSTLFTPIDLKQRVFRRIPRPGAPPAAGAAGAAGLDEMRAEAFAAGPLAQLVLTSGGLVACSNRQLEKTFGVSSRDIGRPFGDLDLAHRPVELRGAVEQARRERRTLRVTGAEHHGDTGVTHLEVQVSPLGDGVGLTFHDVTEARRLRDDLENAGRQIEAAYEELQSANEELETTNEELQSTVEELETTNEELQSTNGELETMNEELRTANDALRSTNDRLRISTARLDEANTFLETVLAGLRAGVAVVDPDLRIRMWNRHAEDLWGLRSGEVIGRHVLNLDIGLPVDRVRPLLRGALGAGGRPGEIRLDAVNRRGRAVTVRVACTPLHKGDGAIIVMETP
jgi:two-component system CheB/CheR fusion protein